MNWRRKLGVRSIKERNQPQNPRDDIAEMGKIQNAFRALHAQLASSCGRRRESRHNAIRMVLHAPIDVGEAHDTCRNTLSSGLPNGLLRLYFRAGVNVKWPELCVFAHREFVLLAVGLATAGKNHPRAQRKPRSDLKDSTGAVDIHGTTERGILFALDYPRYGGQMDDS